MYRLKPPEGSAVTSFILTLSSACKRDRGRYLRVAVLLLPLSFVIIVTSFFVVEGIAHDVLAILGMAAISMALVLLSISGSNTAWICDGSSAATSLERDAADVVRILPLSSCVVVFWVI
jgi:hypothetical protein